MKVKSYNALDFKGRLYDYDLEAGEAPDGGEVIKGKVKVEVDTDGTVVELEFYARPRFKSNKPNSTYVILEDMLAGNINTVVDYGDEAAWYSFTGNINPDYFVSSRDSKGELVRSQRLRGGFINANPKKEYSNKWKLDFLITTVEDIEADAEKNYPRYLKVSGYLVDDYNERLMGCQFQARTPGAIQYILGLSPSAEFPHYVSTWGQIEATKRTIIRKNAFGEDEEDTYENNFWVITGMSPDRYDFGGEDMTMEQFNTLKKGLEAYQQEKIDKAKENQIEEDIAF